MKPEGKWIEEAKSKAASAAVKHVEDGFIVGLGSGSTAAYAIEAIGERIRSECLNVMGIPTSYQAFLLAVKNGISVTTLEEHPTIDLTIDGADQVDQKLNLIKGMGAALAREKIVASASKQNIIIADENKKVQILGENNHPVPVEVLPFALSFVKRSLEDINGRPVVRETKGKVGPVITDNGNIIIDAFLGSLNDAAYVDRELNMIPGVVANGLFVGSTDIVYVGTRTSVEKLTSKQT